jgi:hypothetical protein
MLELLHRGEERVQIEVRDDHGPSVVRPAGGAVPPLVYRYRSSSREGGMAKRSLVSQLAAMGEGAINKNILGGGITQRALEGALSLKDRVEGVVKGLAEVEERMTALEQRVEALEQPKPAARKPRTPAAKPPAKAAAKSTSTARKPRTTKTPSDAGG